jgi:TPR repeat protein
LLLEVVLTWAIPAEGQTPAPIIPPAGNLSTNSAPAAFTPPLGAVLVPNQPRKIAIDNSIDSLRKKAEAGDAKSQYALGLDYYSGFAVGKDLAEAVKWFSKSAEQGNAEAEESLAECYQTGNGVGKDPVEAAKWYRIAAEQGEITAQYNLGLSYDRGVGVEKDSGEAFKWFQKAADRGDAGSELELFFAYSSGDGISENPKKALMWLFKAVNQGNATAEASLGDEYKYGVGGLGQDNKQAFKWFMKAADQGNAMGEEGVAGCYEFGVGTLQDTVEACQWYQRSAMQGYFPAQCGLGLMYLRGKGVLKNEVQGMAWLYLAAANGNAYVADTLLPQYERQYGNDIAATARDKAKELQAQIASRTASTNNESATSIFQRAPIPNTPKASGSGAFISAGGLLLTAAHVVQGATRIDVVTASGTLTATVVKIDASNDVAVLKCAGANFTPLPIAPSKQARAGATVFTVGFPNIQLQGFDPKLTKGEISSQTGFQDDPREWQISVPIQPGNSGGPLCDENGNLIGIVEATLDPLTMAKIAGEIPQNVNYAVKSSYILPLLDDVQNLPAPLASAKGLNFEDVVGNVQKSVVLILVY